MPPELETFIPDPDVLLALEPQELAGFVLKFLKAQGGDTQNRAENKFNFGVFGHLQTVQGYPPEKRTPILRALSEAWGWLEREGLLADRPGEPQGWKFITRLGERIRTEDDFRTFLKAKLLPKDLLHETIAENVWLLFIRGQYDTAIFQAFKEVEVAVRTKGNYPQTLIGVDLMRKAFHPSDGRLTIQGDPPGERQAIMDLFAGAIGSYKNPSSHRHVAIDAPEDVEMIMLARHLLRIIDSRNSTA